MRYEVKYDAYVTQLIASEEHMQEIEDRIKEWAEEQGRSVIKNQDELVII